MPAPGAAGHATRPEPAQPDPAGIAPAALRDRIRPLLGHPLAEIERELIEATIDHCDGSIPRAARMLE
ncbi:MAG: helix-turn-helix domain-containing protein, partial [Fimbriimonadaceae bacterium]